MRKILFISCVNVIILSPRYRAENDIMVYLKK